MSFCVSVCGRVHGECVAFSCHLVCGLVSMPSYVLLATMQTYTFFLWLRNFIATFSIITKRRDAVYYNAVYYIWTRMRAHAWAPSTCLLFVFVGAFGSSQACSSSCLKIYASMLFLDIQQFSLDVFWVCLHFEGAHSSFLLVGYGWDFPSCNLTCCLKISIVRDSKTKLHIL